MKLNETHLYEVWKNQQFTERLKTVSGEDIDVLNAGTHNEDMAGPDFLNAKIRIGILTYVGDIEIDCEINDWKGHGHNIDVKYNKVILHLSFRNNHNQAFVYTNAGRKVPTITLSRFLPATFNSQFEPPPPRDVSNVKQLLRCHEANGLVTAVTRENFILKLGFQRFEKKCKKMYERLKELKYLRDNNIHEPIIGYDRREDFDLMNYSHADFQDKEIWQQLFYESIFEALGYSKNKNIMLELAHNADISFIKSLGHDDEFLERVESALFHISGLLSENPQKNEIDDEQYVSKLRSHWDHIKRIYNAKYFDEDQWHFFKLRPQNFPTVRLAGGSRLLKSIIYDDFINELIKKIDEIRNLNVLINVLRSLIIIKSEGFWRTHYVFNKHSNGEIKYFVGVSRADEMIINVVLPFFSVYFDVFGEQNLSKKLLKIYGYFNQRSENRIVHDVAVSLHMEDETKKTVFQQGMIELFRSFCSKNKCLECEIGKIVFG